MCIFSDIFSAPFLTFLSLDEELKEEDLDPNFSILDSQLARSENNTFTYRHIEKKEKYILVF